MQVAIGLVSAIMWMLDNPNKGVMLPDDLPHDRILEVAKPYIGKLVSKASSWTPATNHRVFFKENKDDYLDKKNLWSFQNFLYRD